MRKEDRPSLEARPVSGPKSFILLLVIGVALSFLASMIAPVSHSSALLIQVGIVDPTLAGFRNGDRDVSDATIFPLSLSDKVPGNVGFTIDTYFAPVSTTVWIGISVEEGGGPVSIDSDDYGTFTNALCNDNNADGADFRDPSDRCVNPIGLNTDHLTIPDAGNVLNPPNAPLPKSGLAIAFTCDLKPGTAFITVGQGLFTFDFFIVCHGPLANVQISASATRLEIAARPGSTAHSVIRLDLFDAFGGIVAGREILWTVNRCGIEVDDVDTVEKALNVLNGFVAPDVSIAPDVNFQSEAGRNLVYDFNGDGKLESIALAIIHCEPAHVRDQTPGPITVTAIVSVPNGQDMFASITINLVGPPANVFLTAKPTNVRCGEKIDVTAVVVDALGQPVSDNTQVGYKVNLGGTGSSSPIAIIGQVAPLSSGISLTRDGVAQFFILTSEVNRGAYQIVATTLGLFSTAPVVGTTSVSCFVPTPTTSPPPAAAAAPASSPQAVAITPPRTGDAGLIR